MTTSISKPANTCGHSWLARFLTLFHISHRVLTLFVYLVLSITINHPLVAQLEPVEVDIGVKSGDVASTPDGNIIVYKDYTRQSLFSFPISGATPQQLTADLSGAFSLGKYQISPDGQNVVYTVTESVSLNERKTILYLIPIMGGTPIQLSPDPSLKNAIFNFEFTPDGNTVIYLSDHDVPGSMELYAVPITGGTSVKLNNPLANGTTILDFVFSPYNNRVVFKTGWFVSELYSSPLTGGGALKLHSVNYSRISYKLSSDGETVVYNSFLASTGAYELFSIPIDGGTPTQISPGLPAGREVSSFFIGANDRVVYTADAIEEDRPHLFSIPITGGTPVQLSSSPISQFDFDIQFNSDRSKVVYKNQISRDLFAQEITGGSETLIGSGIGSFKLNPNDMDLIYSISDELFVVPIMGGQSPVALTNGPHPSNDSAIRDMLFSPDGANVVYIRNFFYIDPRQEVFFSPIRGGGSTSLSTYASFGDPYDEGAMPSVLDIKFVNDDNFIFTAITQSGGVWERNVVIHNLSSALSAASLDGSTQITVTFSENVATNGGNSGDFMVTDGIGNTFPVSAQADGTAGDADIVLTVADVSTAVGDLTITYTNNNDEVTKLATGDPVATDDTGVVIDTDMTTPTLVSAVKDSETQITLTFSELIQTNGTNPTDFIVTDGLGTSFTVSTQADGTAEDMDLVLTVGDLSTAVGDLTVIYTNNNNEISDFGSNDLATDATGVVIDTDNTAPTLVSVVKDTDTQITITLFEPVQTNGTNPTDFIVTDGIGTAFAVSTQADGTAQDTDIVLTVADLSTAIGDLTVTYTDNNNEVSDFGGNLLATDATGVNIDTDMTAPTLVSAVKDSDTQITITLSEPVQTNGGNPADFTVTDGLGTTYSLSAQADGTAQDIEIVLTVADLSAAVGDLTVTYTNNNSEISDFGGNDLATDATGLMMDVDVTAPTMVSAVKNSDTQITIAFTEPVQTSGTNPTDFTIVDDNNTPFAVSAQADGTAEDTDIVLTVADLSSAVTQLTITYANNNNEISDFGGNDMVADAVGVVILLDVIPPDVTLTTMASDPNSGAFDITATFTEDVMNVATSDFNVANGSATAVSGTGAVYTVTITPAADGTVTVDLPANTVQDLANNNNTASNTITLENDETDPTVTISSVANDPTSGAFDITMTFSENVTGFDVSDIMVGNGVAGNFAGSADTYSATITPSADGTVTVDITANGAQDAATNGNTAATQFSIENDETSPTVVISTTANDPVNVPFDITLTFSEDVSGFDLADLVIANGTGSNLTGSGAVYTATITPTADGTLTVDLGAASVQDAAGNDNIAATPFSILADLTAPDVPVVTGISDDTGADTADGITNDNTLIFAGTAEANSTVEVFINAMSLSTTTTDGAGAWSFDHSSVSLAEGNYNITATATDAAGNTSVESTVFPITTDTTIPVKPVITRLSDDNGPENADGITNDRTLIFYGTAEALTTVELKLFGFTFGTSIADANGDWIVDLSGGNITTGNLAFSVVSTDPAGNASTSDDFNTVIEVTAPVVNSITRADANPTTASSVDFTVTFSEEIHGLSTSNFELVFTDTQDADIASVSATSGTSVTVTVNNITGSGTFGLNLSDVVGITDVAGNALAGTFTGEAYNTNFFPTGIILSSMNILENNAIGHAVGTLTTTDGDAGDTHTYSLISGAGDTDNASFTISGDQLLAAEAYDLETKGSYDIRIQTDDGRGGTFERALIITIDNVPEAFLRITGNNDIPATPLGITTSFDITIHNDGDAVLNVSSVLYPTAFGGPVTGITVAPMSSQVVTVDFTPTLPQLYTGDITFITNGGTGILAVSADGAIITSVDNGQLKAESIKLYPNPATDIITIDLSKYNGRSLDIQLYDMSGTKTFSINQYLAPELRLDVSSYQNGLYLVQFSDGKSMVQKKVMIRK